MATIAERIAEISGLPSATVAVHLSAFPGSSGSTFADRLTSWSGLPTGTVAQHFAASPPGPGGGYPDAILMLPGRPRVATYEIRISQKIAGPTAEVRILARPPEARIVVRSAVDWSGVSASMRCVAPPPQWTVAMQSFVEVPADVQIKAGTDNTVGAERANMIDFIRISSLRDTLEAIKCLRSGTTASARRYRAGHVQTQRRAGPRAAR
jgi:hypothetical protein